jgi:hypothetical protein
MQISDDHIGEIAGRVAGVGVASLGQYASTGGEEQAG